MVDIYSSAGPEFRVNTTTSGPQHSSEIVQLSNGNFVFVWTSFHLVDGEVLG